MDYIKELRKKVGNSPIILCACGCIIYNENNEILLEERVDDNKWGLPGGCMELGETIEETAYREVLEETGLKVENLKLFNIYSGKKEHHIYPNGDEVYFVNIVFETNKFSGELHIADNESKSLKFFGIDKIPKQITESCKCIIDDLKK